METYLSSSQKQFAYYKSLGEKTFTQLKDTDLFRPVSSENNSVAVIVQHLHGNMMSRWTDFLSSDGEKEWRERDKEFEEVIETREEMMHKWNEGWSCLFGALNALKTEDLNRTVFIRNQGHSIIDAINRQLCHYAYHVGQIVFAGKFLAKTWTTLSIARNQSKSYNSEKFSREKGMRHFTDEFLGDGEKQG